MLRLRFILLVAVVAVVAHDATYLIGHGLDGYPAALGATGHDGHWLPVAISVAGLLMGAATVAAARWRRLRRQLGELPGTTSDHRIGPILSGTLRLAIRLFVAAVGVFVFQENLEAIALGAAAPGLEILVGPGYLAAVPAVALVALLFAAMSELIDARIQHLERALAVARDALPRPSARMPRAPREALGQVRSRTAEPNLGRAPPASAHA
jgi:hypothetical protein